MKAPGGKGAVVAVHYNPNFERPWIMQWSGPYQFVMRGFQSREEAVAVARRVAIGDAPFDSDMAVYPAKLPFSTTVPSPKTIEALVDVADGLLAAVLRGRGTK